MINFIICEDNMDFLKQYESIIAKCVMPYDFEYEVSTFSEYDEKFEELVKRCENFNIYLLDIVTKSGSGLDASRMIREKYEDWNSMIIIISSYSQYKYEALTNRFMLLDFINKLDNFENSLSDAISKAIKNYDNRPKMLSYEYNQITTRINFKDITYIEKEQGSKRCIIYADKKEYLVPRGLISIEKSLDDRFYKIHRSLIINTDKIKVFDSANNVIIFKNGKTTNLISRDKKKGLIDYVSSDN